MGNLFEGRGEARTSPGGIVKSFGLQANGRTESYSGVDIQAVMFLPMITNKDPSGKEKPLIKAFAELQTISISSTRSVSPVRVLGRSNPIGHTRGARTFAGTMVFAVINKTVFEEVYNPSFVESIANTTSSIFIDQMPPFSIMITAANEFGGVSYQIVNGITIANYGTAYSIDDLFLEETYTYLATDVTPILPIETPFTPRGPGQKYKTVSEVMQEQMLRSYGTTLKEYEDMLESTAPAVSRVNQSQLEQYREQGLNPEAAKYEVDSRVMRWVSSYTARPVHGNLVSRRSR